MTDRAGSGPGWHETRLGPTWLVALALCSALVALVVVVTMFPQGAPTSPAEPSSPGRSTDP